MLLVALDQGRSPNTRLLLLARPRFEGHIRDVGDSCALSKMYADKSHVVA
jgi:hypothetical protein